MGITKKSGPTPRSLQTLTVRSRKPLPIKSRDKAITPEIDAVIQRAVDEGLTVDKTVNRVEVEVGTALSRKTVNEHMQAVRAARIDALRALVPDFSGDNVARCGYYATEVAAIAQTFLASDADRYLQFSGELRAWIKLQEQIRQHALQSNTLQVNVMDGQAKEQLVGRIAQLIERAEEASDPVEPDGSGG